MNIKSIIDTALSYKVSYLVAIALGSFIGVYTPEYAEAMGPVADIFMNIVKMCVLPIVVTSISLSVAHFMLKKLPHSILRISTIMVITLITCSVLGSSIALLLQPGANIDPSSSEVVKELLESASQSRMTLDEPLEARLTTGAIQVILGAIPSNIFNALASNSIFQVIIFSLIFGFALGKFSEYDSHIMELFRQTLEVFTSLFETLIFYFPLVLVLLLAKAIAEVGPHILVTLGSFVLKFYVAVLILFIISTLVIVIRTKTGLGTVLQIMRDPIIISLASGSSPASLPSSILSMERFNFDPNLVKLFIPLGAVMAQFGQILYFGFCAIFALQLYGIDLSLVQYIVLSLVIVLAGLSTAGQGGEISLNSLAIVLTPIGIPLSGMLPLLHAVDPIINPLRTLGVVYTNCAALTLIDKPQGGILSGEEVRSMEEAEAKE